MLIIFQLNSNQIATPTIIILSILVIIAPQTPNTQCLEHTFTTSFTRCRIVFEKCLYHPAPTNTAYQAGFGFKNCSMFRCSTFASVDQCKNMIDFALEERECYESCCKSQRFDRLQCQKNNEDIKATTSTMNLYLFVFLGICVVGLLVAILCFLSNEMRCFDKTKILKQEAKGPIWRAGTTSNLQCNLCNEAGAVIQTGCKHFFHIQCYRISNSSKPLKGQCHICDQFSSSYRVWCNECQEKYIKINFNEIKTIEELSLHYQQSKCLHDDCMKDLHYYVKTDLRLSSTALS